MHAYTHTQNHKTYISKDVFNYHGNPFPAHENHLLKKASSQNFSFCKSVNSYRYNYVFDFCAQLKYSII